MQLFKIIILANVFNIFVSYFIKKKSTKKESIWLFARLKAIIAIISKPLMIQQNKKKMLFSMEAKMLSVQLKISEITRNTIMLTLCITHFTK